MFTSTHLAKQLPKLTPKCMVQLVLKASICHKSELPQKNVYQWPYEKLPYNLLYSFWDPLTKRKFTENSKIILIEGNVACGKKHFGQRLADELGMKFMPEVDLESYYINEHGYDYRALNPLLPERLRLCDWSMYHENPLRHSTIHMQHHLFKLRLYQYIQAMQHIFSTGQGVVMSRSVFTERVFVEAMHNIGWLPQGYLRGDGARFYDWKCHYELTRNLCLSDLHKPHLTIYLETPVETCMKRIKASEDPMIANSRALVPELLENIQQAYNDLILPKLELNGLVLRYKYDEPITDAELGDVIDDINELDFSFDHHDTRFQEWNPEVMYFWHYNTRRLYASYKFLGFFEHLYQSWYDIAGMGDSISDVDLKLREGLFEGHVGPFGRLQSFEHDSKIHGLFYSLFGSRLFSRRSFGEEQYRILRSDYY